MIQPDQLIIVTDRMGGQPSIKPPINPLPSVHRAFPVAAEFNVPSYEDIPSRFRLSNDHSDLAMGIFYGTINTKDLAFVPHDTIKSKIVYLYLLAVLALWDIPHEHKTALTGFMLWSWFDCVLNDKTGRVYCCGDGRKEHWQGEIKAMLERRRLQA